MALLQYASTLFFAARNAMRGAFHPNGCLDNKACAKTVNKTNIDIAFQLMMS